MFLRRLGPFCNQIPVSTQRARPSTIGADQSACAQGLLTIECFAPANSRGTRLARRRENRTAAHCLCVRTGSAAPTQPDAVDRLLGPAVDRPLGLANVLRVQLPWIDRPSSACKKRSLAPSKPTSRADRTVAVQTTAPARRTSQ